MITWHKRICRKPMCNGWDNTVYHLCVDFVVKEASIIFFIKATITTLAIIIIDTITISSSASLSYLL